MSNIKPKLIFSHLKINSTITEFSTSYSHVTLINDSLFSNAHQCETVSLGFTKATKSNTLFVVTQNPHLSIFLLKKIQ